MLRTLQGLALAILLALTPGLALASVTTTGAGMAPSGSGGGGGYTGPGDLVSGAKAWFGLRAYSAAKAAAQVAAVRLVRSSDSHQCDLNVTTAGGLATVTANCSTTGDNGSTASTWCASGAGSCTVGTWYDQSGNGNNATAGLAAGFVFNCIGTLPCLSFDGTKALANTSLTATGPAMTVSTVVLHTSGFTTQNDIIAAANGVFFYNSSGTKLGGYFGGTNGVSVTDDAFHVAQVVLTGTTSSTINVDGAETGGLNLGTSSMQLQPWIGAQSSTPTNPLHGQIAELGLWPTNFTTGAGAQAAQVCHNQGAYFSISVTC